MTGSNSEPIVEGKARISGQWMTISDAASSLGVSEKTLRRKRDLIKTKRLGDSINSKIFFWINDEVRQLLSNTRIDTDGFEDVLATAIEVEETEPEIVGTERLEEPENATSPPVNQSTEQAQSTTAPPAASQVNEQTENTTAPPPPNQSTEQAGNTTPPPAAKQLTEQEKQQQAFIDVLQEYMRPLVARVEEQAVIIADRDRKIEELEINLRLLPDKRKEEDAERQCELESVSAELKSERELREKRESELEDMKARVQDLERAEQELKAANDRPAWKKWFGIKS